MNGWNKLGLIAGAGDLPVQIANVCDECGIDYHIVRLKGLADDALAVHPGADCAIGQAGKILQALSDAGCDAVVFAGVVKRPDFNSLNIDMRGMALMPKILAAASLGDGHILKVLVETIEKEGFVLVGAEEVVATLAAPEGCLGRHAPTDKQLEDIKKAARIVHALGQFDVGQGAVVSDGFVLAVEAAEGTDVMLERCAALPNNVSEGGVLVKRPKPGQELRIDLPTIGPETVRNAVRASLAGIALEHGVTLILQKSELVKLADEAGLFVYGFTAGEVAE